MKYHSFIYDLNTVDDIENFFHGSTWLKENVSDRPESVEHYEGGWSFHAREYVDPEKLDLPWYWEHNKNYYIPSEGKSKSVIIVHIRDDKVVMMYKMMGF